MSYRLPQQSVLVWILVISTHWTGASAALAAGGAPRVASAAEPAAPPWRVRLRRGLRYPFKGFARVADWPAEPTAPAKLAPERFAAALQTLCGPRLGATRAARYARWMIEHGERFSVDPTLIAAAAYRRSRCSARYSSKRGDDLGLLGISWKMHKTAIKRGEYLYYRKAGDGWQRKQLAIDRFRWSKRALRRPEASIYLGAALLSIYREQCRELDALAKSRRRPTRPHRHFVSHLLFGDRVLGARAEDEILRARRRLLGYYAQGEEPAPPRPGVTLASVRQVKIHSPLDGAPRRISSPYRAKRGKRRRHRGVDFYSTWGEPVRAVADGVVYFAGVQPRRRRAVVLSPARAKRWPRRRMGIGGLFVLINHANKVESRYFHLSSYIVRRGARVKAGQIIGYVGRTGIKQSPTHLHFEMRSRGRNINPTRYLKPHLIWPGKKRPSIG